MEERIRTALTQLLCNRWSTCRKLRATRGHSNKNIQEIRTQTARGKRRCRAFIRLRHPHESIWVPTLMWGVLSNRSSSLSSSSSGPFWSSSASWFEAESQVIHHNINSLTFAGYKKLYFIVISMKIQLLFGFEESRKCCTYILCQTRGAVKNRRGAVFLILPQSVMNLVHTH